MTRSKNPKLYDNWISIIGFYLVLFGITGELFFFFLDFFTGISTAYLGILYLLLLAQVLFGFFVVGLGIYREARRRKSGLEPTTASEITIKNPVMVLVVSTLVVTGFTVVIGLGSYTAYHVTESNVFCGQTCHSAMNPEWVTYHNSAHARVDCVECHIGSGADWYVKSKLSGIRQVFAVMADTFPRPIPTPIHNLRPARETCENCHWKRKNIGNKEILKTYYMSDEKSSTHNIRLLMMIGGGRVENAQSFGIHYHMLIETDVEYIARDEKRQDIALVRSQRHDGSVLEFKDEDNPLTEEELKRLEVRTMDCMDCHNRAAHRFPTPMESVNDAITEGLISRELPFIKLKSVQALSRDYVSKSEAFNQIALFFRDYYQEEFPVIFKSKKPLLEQTVAEIQKIYEQTVFPEMKTSWKSYPDNIGHKNWSGCFRCHNDRLKNTRGESIFTACNKCHLILSQGKDLNNVKVDFIKGIKFIHPNEEEMTEEFLKCTDCHLEITDIYE
ncbi:MAG: NapC/NirT family cytochrome c [Deltaproteobacteria bacterium]|nr:NapC/NirT family cytochrome c [Deltaproteobacteria bacterium]